MATIQYLPTLSFQPFYLNDSHQNDRFSLVTTVVNSSESNIKVSHSQFLGPVFLHSEVYSIQDNNWIQFCVLPSEQDLTSDGLHDMSTQKRTGNSIQNKKVFSNRETSNAVKEVTLGQIDEVSGSYVVSQATSPDTSEIVPISPYTNGHINSCLTTLREELVVQSSFSRLQQLEPEQVILQELMHLVELEETPMVVA